MVCDVYDALLYDQLGNVEMLGQRHFFFYSCSPATFYSLSNDSELAVLNTGPDTILIQDSQVLSKLKVVRHTCKYFQLSKCLCEFFFFFCFFK